MFACYNWTRGLHQAVMICLFLTEWSQYTWTDAPNHWWNRPINYAPLSVCRRKSHKMWYCTLVNLRILCGSVYWRSAGICYADCDAAVKYVNVSDLGYCYDHFTKFHYISSMSLTYFQMCYVLAVFISQVLMNLFVVLPFLGCIECMRCSLFLLMIAASVCLSVSSQLHCAKMAEHGTLSVRRESWSPHREGEGCPVFNFETPLLSSERLKLETWNFPHR